MLIILKQIDPSFCAQRPGCNLLGLWAPGQQELSSWRSPHHVALTLNRWVGGWVGGSSCLGTTGPTKMVRFGMQPSRHSSLGGDMWYIIWSIPGWSWEAVGCCFNGEQLRPLWNCTICGCSCPQSFVKGVLIRLLCSDKGLSRVHDIMIGNWMNEYERSDQHGTMWGTASMTAAHVFFSCGFWFEMFHFLFVRNGASQSPIHLKKNTISLSNNHKALIAPFQTHALRPTSLDGQFLTVSEELNTSWQGGGSRMCHGCHGQVVVNSSGALIRSSENVSPLTRQSYVE